MATAFSPGGQSPTSLSRTIEKVLEEAQHTGEVILSGRKLKEYPKVSSKYDLIDTIHTDLSRNRFTEIPADVCNYHSMERLNCSHNVLRSIPKALIQLQSLVHLNLSRNQLTMIPPFINQLCSLEVLIASNNKLVSLPEEIGTLDRLMEVDVSCNEITHLPPHIGDLLALCSLNLRHNLLVEIPVELCKLQLRHLDLSQNKISHVPVELRKMDTLADLNLHHNPLICPPAHICTKGRIHLMKFLHREALKEDRKQNVLNDVDMRRSARKIPSLQNSSTSEELQYLDSPSERRKRHTTDSGYSTDSIERSRWSPSEALTDVEESHALPLRAADVVREQRHERHPDGHKRLTVTIGNGVKPGSPQATSSPGSAGTIVARPDFFPDHMEPIMPDVDQFTRVSGSRGPSGGRLSDDGGYPNSCSISAELQRQKSAYEEKKRRAEQLRREVEEEEREREERRRAAIKLQEEQKALMQKKGKSLPSSPAYSHYMSEAPRMPHSQSFREDKRSSASQYRRTVSDSAFSRESSPMRSRTPDISNAYRNNGVIPIEVQHLSSGGDGRERLRSMSPALRRSVSPLPNNHINSDDEFRRRYQAMITQQQQEAQRIQQEVLRIRQVLNANTLDKQAYYNYIQQQAPGFLSLWLGPVKGNSDNISCSRSSVAPATPSLNPPLSVTTCSVGSGPDHRRSNSTSEDDAEFSFSRDSTPNTSFESQSSTVSNKNSNCSLPIAVQRGLEEMSKELNNINPAFTIRRHINQAQEDIDMVQQLRNNIEGRLKVKLPEDLPSALRDGVVLCHLANHIRPRSVSSIHVPSPAVPKLSTAKCRRNIENFLEACRRIGVEQDKICATASILEEKGIVQLAATVDALLACANGVKQSCV